MLGRQLIQVDWGILLDVGLQFFLVESASFSHCWLQLVLYHFSPSVVYRWDWAFIDGL